MNLPEIKLTCPNCGKTFPIVLPPIGGPGSCGCALDFALTVAQGGMQLDVKWTPDPKFPQSGTETYHESYGLV